jgi:cytochrome c oxidase subunit 2
MAGPKRKRPQKVLIASSHALFGQGLRSLLRERHKAQVEIVGVVSNLREALVALETLSPDLVIVDHDDETLNRDEFLARFLEGERRLRVVFVSLQSSETALVYDRRMMAAAQIDDWLQEWTTDQKRTLSGRKIKEGNKNTGLRRNGMKHFIAAAILVIIVTALLIVGLQYAHLLPIAASAQAKPIDQLFNLEFKVIAFLFSLIVVFMGYSIVVFRRRKGDTTDGPHIEGNVRLEVLWTLAPLATVLYFAYLGGDALAQTLAKDQNPIQINVVGSQWSWRFEYPDQGIITTTLYLPVGKQALLHLSSTDVIHSFWVPEFRVKQDALPGGDAFVRDLRVTPTVKGDYKVRCSELCGLRHAYMEAPVKVVSPSEFDTWVAQETAQSADPVVRGQKWATTFGCAACHSVDGKAGVGPTWKGLYGSTVTFTDGSSTTADDAYLQESIRNPAAKIVQGFTNIMPPNIAEKMTDAQVQDVIEYIKSLK